MARIHVDMGRLYDGGGDDFEVWLDVLVDRVHDTMRKQQESK